MAGRARLLLFGKIPMRLPIGAHLQFFVGPRIQCAGRALEHVIVISMMHAQ